MFERFTERARRALFFARYEAQVLGSGYVETEHLLLGLLREDKPLAMRFLRSHGAVDAICREIESHAAARGKDFTSTELPLSHRCKRGLAYAGEEAGDNRQSIGTEHILVGLLRDEKSLIAELLRARGVTLTSVREALQKPESEES